MKKKIVVSVIYGLTFSLLLVAFGTGIAHAEVIQNTISGGLIHGGAKPSLNMIVFGAFTLALIGGAVGSTRINA